MKGIDVAKWNGVINWLLVKNADAYYVVCNSCLYCNRIRGCLCRYVRFRQVGEVY